MRRAAWLGLALALAAGCEAGPDAPVDLRPVVLPALDGADDSVRGQITRAFTDRLVVAEDVTRSAAERGAAYGALGRLLYAARLPEAAEPALANATALDAGEPAWPYYLAHVHREQGALPEAAAMFDETLRRAPGDAAASVWLGRVYLSLDRIDDAEAAFTRAAAVASAARAARAGLGQVALAREDYQGAAREIEAVLAGEPEASSLYYQLGLAYRGLGDTARAETALAARGEGPVGLADPRLEALDEVLDSALSYQRRGVAALNRGAAAEAAARFRDGLAVAPAGDATLRLSLMQKLGSALWLMGRRDEAVQQFEAGVRLDPTFALNHYSLGVAAATGGDLAEARRRFELAVGYDPDDLEARLALGRVLHGQGDPAAAVVQFGRALELAPAHADARYFLVAALADAGRLPEARVALTEGLRLHPDDTRFAAALVTLGGR